MTAPIVFISRHRIHDGKHAEFASLYAKGVGFIESAKPRTALFSAYLDEAGTEVSIVHAFPDAAALTLHFEGSGERTSSVSELITPASFAVYGPAPAPALDQLRREAAAAGAALDVVPDSLGGFLRPPA